MNMNEYGKIKKSLDSVTNLKAVDEILMTTTQHRNQLNEIIELALNKQAELTPKSTDDKW